jgi:hypothetical protein
MDPNISHNISKIQLQSTCRFWDTTDLGLTVLYFSCNNYQENLWSCCTQVVGFFTGNPTKLSLHFSSFSTIFYGFYKNHHKGFTIQETNYGEVLGKFPIFIEMPSRQKVWHPCPPVAVARRRRCGAHRVKKMAQGCDWTHMGSIVEDSRTGTAPARVFGGARLQRPLELRFRWGWGGAAQCVGARASVGPSGGLRVAGRHWVRA